MYRLRLFHQKDMNRELDRRLLKGGELTVGRDPGVGWKVTDPDRAVSRAHCIFNLERGRLTVRDISSNGVFVGDGGAQAPRGEAVPIAAGALIRVGGFVIAVEEAAEEDATHTETVAGFSGTAGLAPGSSPFAPPRRFDPEDTVLGQRREPAAFAPPDLSGAGLEAPFVRPILEAPQVQAGDVAVPAGWDGSTVPHPTLGGGTKSSAATDGLFEAFCAGARLDPAAFAREDRVQLMRNLGAVYQQMVLGLGDLLSERTSVRSEYRMERTTVRAEGNNPFKWSPPARVAVDLLRTTDDGFLTGPAAVKDSFEDLKKHLLCVLAGLRAALSSTLDALGPDAVESRVNGAAKLFASSREARAWAEYRRLFTDLKKQAGDNPDSRINRDFRAGYERQLAALDSLKPPP
jgi:type VI secretion system FHA domain protein